MNILSVGRKNSVFLGRFDELVSNLLCEWEVSKIVSNPIADGVSNRDVGNVVERLGEFTSTPEAHAPSVFSGHLTSHHARPTRRSATHDLATQTLHRAGLEGPLVAELANGAERIPSDSLATWLRSRIAARLRVSRSLLRKSAGTPRAIACVGPSGSGKTTTLAKLAARARLSLGQSVTVVSLDGFRVGAAEQWQRYADLLGIRFLSAIEGLSLRRALEQEPSDLVLIDTPSARLVSDLKGGALASARPGACALHVATRDLPCPLDALLVVPAWMKSRDAWRVMAAHAETPLSGMVISKVDETDQIGGALQVALPYGIPISFLCNGPRVPEDIQDADVNSILDATLAVKS